MRKSFWKGAKLLAIAAAVLLCGQSYGQSAVTEKKPADDAKARQERIENGIEPVELGKGQDPIKLSLPDLMKTFKVPALSVAVIDNYKIAWVKAYGVTGLGGTEAATPKTLFQAGSISKPVAASGMLVLAQQGKLALDEDVNLKLKSWKVPENEFTKEQKVTLRRLASHTAGLTVHGFPGYDVDDKVPSVVQVLDGVKPPANTAPVRVDFVPGTKWRYSGGGVTIEQLVMTDVTGKSFPALMKELVLDREGMTDSTYEQPLPTAWQSRTATGTYRNGNSVHGKWHIYPEMAAAGLWTTPTDLAKFVIEIALSKQGKSNKVLTQKAVEEMLTHPPSAPEFGIGFAVPADRPGEFGHNGADEGFQAQLIMNADTGQGVAIMANSDNGILVANEYVRSLAREYGWKNKVDARGIGEDLMLLAKLRGADAAFARCEELEKASGKKSDEGLINMMGYVMLTDGKVNDAIRFFQKNVVDYPDSSNVYDSLGEAYAAAGKKDLAIANYEKSIELNPKNTNGVEWLKKLRGNQ